MFELAGALSSKGTCTPFAADADGMIPGEGAVLMFLEPVATALSFVGDLLSDLLAARAGCVGALASAGLGANLAIFAPVHGTAPDLVAQVPLRANPLGAIRAMAMLLDHVGHREKSRVIREACDHENLRTPDAGGTATTTQVGEAIAQKVAMQS
jgi:isocitrate/isopropylmalate dehydrogenase